MGRIEQLTQQIQELEKELAIEKRKAEVLYLIQKTEDCWNLLNDGCITKGTWEGFPYEKNLYAQGNVFHTQEEAEKERDRRILLTRFRQFRDKCNGDWKPNWKSDLKGSVNYFIERYYVDGKEEWCSEWYRRVNNFHLFGYFKNKEDCDRAIELFGDEIKRLYLEE